MKLSHLTKDQKRQRTNEMAWRRQIIDYLNRDQYSLSRLAIAYINDPTKKDRLISCAQSMYRSVNQLKLINERLKKYEPHTQI